VRFGASSGRSHATLEWRTLVPLGNDHPWHQDKPALVAGPNATAACAVRNLSMLSRMAETGGTQAAIEWLKRIPDYQRDVSADLGSASTPLRRRSLAASRSRSPTMFDPSWRLPARLPRRLRAPLPGRRGNGLLTPLRVRRTADAFVEIDGEIWLLDYKTGSGVYADSALQLAGLARAQFIGRTGDPTPYQVPRARRFASSTSGRRARLLPVVVNRQTVAAFLDARRLFGWDQGPAQSVIGQPLIRTSKTAAGLSGSFPAQGHAMLRRYPPPAMARRRWRDPVPSDVRAQVLARDRGCVFTRWVSRTTASVGSSSTTCAPQAG